MSAADKEIQKPPLSVNAPIALDSKEGLREFQEFVAGLEAHPNTEAAFKESLRLMPYFKAMSRYLSKRLPAWDPELQDLVTPARLQDLFNAIARVTRNTVLSDVVVLSTDITQNDYYRLRFGFNSNYNYNGKEYNFGFAQVYEGGKKPIYNFSQGSSIAFPIFLIDAEVMKTLKKHGLEDLLKHFQDVMSCVNHDMLHHYTSPYISANIAHPFGVKWNAPVRKWSSAFFRDNSYEEENYETWAHIVQEMIALDPDNADFTKKIIPHLDQYFSGLKKLGAKMMLSDQAREAHRTVDFLGMLMLQAVIRVFPLNHPVTQECISLLEGADPAPSEAKHDCFETLSTSTEAKKGNMKEMLKAELETPSKAGQEIIRSILMSKHDMADRVLDGYKLQGLDIYPRDNESFRYSHYKMLQLVAMGGLEGHAPWLPASLIPELRQRAREITQKMIKAVAETAVCKF